MEEKVIIKGNATSAKLIPIICWLLAIGLGIATIACLESEDWLLPILIPLVVLSVALAIFFQLYTNGCEICVTDKRVYGKAAFGSRVDIPFDSISAVGLITLLHGVSVGSSSGKISFCYIKNATEIHAELSKMLNSRQKNTANAPTPISSDADELAKYKKLFDEGVINEEEFAAKKKQILGI